MIEPVAIPVRDTTTEVAQLAMASALGAAAGSAVRRRPPRRPTGAGAAVIDITDG